jgi:tRNA(fMet)-specific endonuclease VapC
MKYLLDTNVISELLAPQPNERVVRWIDTRDPRSVYLSVITIGEIQKGVAKLGASKRKDAIQQWLETDILVRFEGQIATLSVPVMLMWGTLVARLEQGGTPIAALDSMIAAIALENRMMLATRNESHFKYTGVSIVNPWNEES